MIGFLFLIGSGICFKNFDSFVESNALTSGKTYKLSYDGTTWATEEIKTGETLKKLGACEDEEGDCIISTVDSNDFISGNTDCATTAYSEAAVAAAFHDIFRGDETIKEFYKEGIFSTAQLVGCEIKEEKTNPVDGEKVKGEKCVKQTHVLAAIQSAIEKPLALQSCVAFKADGIYACDDKCTETGKDYSTPVPSFIFKPKVGVMVGATAAEIKKHLSSVGPVFVPAVMDKDSPFTTPSYYYSEEATRTSGAYQVYCSPEVTDAKKKENIWIELIGYKTIKAEIDSTAQKDICFEAKDSKDVDVFQFRLPKGVQTSESDTSAGSAYTLIDTIVSTPTVAGSDAVTYVSLVDWRKKAEEDEKKTITDAYFVYYPEETADEVGANVRKYNAETKLISSEKVDLETTKVYTKHHDDQKAAESFCIFESEEKLYSNKQVENNYAAAVAKDAWAFGKESDLLLLDVYYFASNLVNSLGEKKVSATGTFANIPNYGNGAGEGLSVAAKEAALDELLMGYKHAASTVKIETTVAEASKVGDAKTDGVAGDSLSFCSIKVAKDATVSEADLKKYIAWFGPVKATFSVDEATLKAYMVKREKSAVMEYVKPTHKSNEGPLDLTVVLLGWQAAKEEGEVKTPKHWIAKTLYPTQEAPAPKEESNEADYEGRVIKIAIQNEAGVHVTDKATDVQFALYSGEQPGPGPKPDDAAFGMVPSLFTALFTMLVAFLF